MSFAKRSKWQDGRRAWERLNEWHLRPAEGYENEARDYVGRTVAAALTDVAFVRQLLDGMELNLVHTARARGVSWSEIATPLGLSKQAAWDKWRVDLDADYTQGS